MRRIVLGFLCILAFSGDLLAQQDTAWIEYREIPGYEYHHMFKHKDDPHPQDYFPFNGSNYYIIPKVNEVNGSRNLYFSYHSHGPEGTAAPFYYLEVNKEYIKAKDFLGKEWFESTSYPDLLDAFLDRDKIIMLYDATQPSGDIQYVVRVYFDFDGYE
ncbi:MAG: hypothetical protein WBG62_09500 [Cyclobacteriaceae bacterium]